MSSQKTKSIERESSSSTVAQSSPLELTDRLAGLLPSEELEKARTQRRDPALVMAIATPLDDPAVAVGDARGVFFAGPIDASETTLVHDSSLQSMILTAAGGEVPWRVLIDGALRARLPVAAQGTSTDRREALVSLWPSTRASAFGALPAAAGTTKDDQ